MRELFTFIRELVDIPSLSGAEGDLAVFLEQRLGERGFSVELQEVEKGRLNVYAHQGMRPRVVLCTHLDTVPPFIASSEDAHYIYGRGSCDAKGSLAALVESAHRLAQQGLREVALLLVVGEEVDGAGAKAANLRPPGCDYVIVGEPTENIMASGHKGAFKFVLRAQGKAAHSAYPDQGDSAIDRLLDALERVRRADWGRSDVLGNATVNIGILQGGVADNVLAPSAEAKIFVRVVAEAAAVKRKLEELIANDPRLSYQLVGEKSAVRCETLPGFEVAAVAFGTDIPYLTAFGKPLLLGPGSILDAHTPQERVGKREVREAVDLYCRLVARLVQGGGDESR